MLKIFKRTVLLSFLAIFVFTQAFAQHRSHSRDNADDNAHDHHGHAPGTWDAIIKDNTVNIMFYGAHWSSGRNFTTTELGTLPTSKIGGFTVSRESGTLLFNGIFQNHWGHGTYQLTENPGFKSYLEKRGYTGLDKELMMNIFFTDINKGYFEFMAANGYGTITSNQLRDLAEQDLNRKVLENYFNLFKAENYGRQTIAKIVELREHGVDPEFIRGFHSIGYTTVPLNKALDLRDHGVSPEFIIEFKKNGYGDISLDRAQDLVDHGVNPEFVREIQKLGYKQLTLETAQELRDHGVTADFIESIHKLGFKDVSLEKAQELRDHGVTAAFIEQTKSKRLANIHTLDDYIRLRDTGF